MSEYLIEVVSASWCTACDRLKKQLTTVGLPFTEIDIETDEGKALQEKYNIRSVPFSIVRKNGEVIETKTGMFKLSDLRM